MEEERRIRVDESLSTGSLKKNLTGDSESQVDLTNYSVSPSGNITRNDNDSTSTQQSNPNNNPIRDED